MSTLTPAGQKLLAAVTSCRYFVAYVGANVRGMIEVNTEQPIRGMADVDGICRHIERVAKPKIHGEIVVINWILL